MATVEENIIHSISKNGYPEKSVSLPFQPVFKAAKNSDTTISEVLKNLEQQGIKSKIEGDKILFFNESYKEKEQEPESKFDFSNDMLKQAMDKIKDMDPQEVEKIKKQVMDMSPEEQERLMKQAKDYFSKNTKS